MLAIEHCEHYSVIGAHPSLLDMLTIEHREHCSVIGAQPRLDPLAPFMGSLGS